MASISRSLRLLALLLIVVIAGGALWAWRRDRLSPSTVGPDGDATWPPLEAVPMRAAAVAHVEEGGGSWVEPMEDGSCPPTHPIKANQSGIYHVPGGRFYDRTKPERCYADAEAAEHDGYRAAKA